jgi:5,10-methylenetetrahydromethanopterin reductase
MYLNVVVDENIERGIALSAGGITSFARFSVLHGSVNGPVEDRVHTALEALPGEYQMSQHFHSGNRAADIAPSLASTFAIVGGPQYCIERLLEISALGVDRFYIVGPTRDADREGAKRAARRFVEFVLPKLATTS